MWCVFNEFGEFVCSSYKEKEAQKLAKEYNGHCAFCDPYYYGCY